MSRPALATGAILLAALVVAAAALFTGSFALRPGAVWDALRGTSDDRVGMMVIRELRLPRIVAAAAMGAALGMAGAIFQGVCRNPLASPDVIGFTHGAAAGAVGSILLLGPLRGGVAAGALVGGFATSALVAALGLRRGMAGERLVLTGIAVGASLAALNEFMISRADLERAEAARTWLFGSLNGVSGPGVTIPALAIAGLLPLVALGGMRLRLLRMGDDVAAGLGVPVSRARVLLLGAAVALTALATAIGGPVNFLALAAPPIAQGLCRTPEPGLLHAAAVGALLLLAADLLAQRLLAPFQIPVGLVTGALGGIYLLMLLTRKRA